MTFLNDIKKALILTVIFIVLLCAVYPAVVTLVGRVAFPGQSAGSLIDSGGRTLGSSLIGQPFSDAKYFWSRPSATASTGSMPDDPMASGGSNLGPTNPALLDEINGNVAALRDSGVTGSLPMDLVTSSGSGLDPDITIEAALVQVPRVAAARGVSEDRVRQLVNAREQGRVFGFLGTQRVNVTLLNLDLDSTLS